MKLVDPLLTKCIPLCTQSETYLAAFVLLWKSTRGRHHGPNVTVREKSQCFAWLSPHPSASGIHFCLPLAAHVTLGFSYFFDTICNVSVSWHALASKYTLMSLFSCRFRRRGKKYLAYRKVWKILLGFCSRELNISLQIVKAKLKKIPYKSLASGHISKNTFCFLLLFCSFKKYKISHLFLSSKDVRGRSKSAVC